MKKALNAQKLRIILAAAMILLISGAVAGFIFAQRELQNFATSISQLEADANAGDNNVATLKQLQDTLKGVSDVKEKADSIAVPASDYPVAVIQNITNIARRTGVSLTAISYSGEGSTPAGSAPTTQTTPTTPTTVTPAPTTGAADPSGATKKTINVTTETPLNYDTLMRFLRRIESDNMYMHITKVSMTKGEGNSVTTQPFTIEVYVR